MSYQSQLSENSRRCLPFILNDLRLGSVENLLEAGYPCSHPGMHIAAGNQDQYGIPTDVEYITHVLLALM